MHFFHENSVTIIISDKFRLPTVDTYFSIIYNLGLYLIFCIIYKYAELETHEYLD